jgi:hypothetical protein
MKYEIIIISIIEIKVRFRCASSPKICEILNPTNCDTATVGVTVTATIDAVADAELL